jgi:hypothetical protein
MITLTVLVTLNPYPPYLVSRGGDRMGPKATLQRSMGGGLGTLRIEGTFCPTGGHSEGGGDMGTWAESLEGKGGGPRSGLQNPLG